VTFKKKKRSLSRLGRSVSAPGQGSPQYGAPLTPSTRQPAQGPQCSTDSFPSIQRTALSSRQTPIESTSTHVARAAMQRKPPSVAFQAQREPEAQNDVRSMPSSHHNALP
jgi:hypothetical protein